MTSGANSMTKPADVAIIGAGPYGLSVAAHLRSRGREPRVFGDPMKLWRMQMPKGMRLTSEGFASRFESSIPGLYFAGPISANTFGPLCRFAFGAGFAAKRVMGSIAATAH
jgi:cation diffusion facilitator CzcD-associated flavoprotein CzcO